MLIVCVIHAIDNGRKVEAIVVYRGDDMLVAMSTARFCGGIIRTSSGIIYNARSIKEVNHG